jgi:hypothetical protein
MAVRKHASGGSEHRAGHHRPGHRRHRLHPREFGRPCAIRRLERRQHPRELLKQKRYSLLFEGGHRWIDLRRYGRLDASHVAVDTPDDVIHARFPVPLTETQGR